MAEPYRILVTGSRDWADLPLLRDEVLTSVRELGADRVVIVHGKCDPRDPQTRQAVPWAAAERLPLEDQRHLLGADWLADRIAGTRGIWIKRYPADWDKHGRAAGFIRNEEMVCLGASLCLAFLAECTKPGCPKRKPHGSHGGSHCANLAEAAGIETRRFQPWLAARGMMTP